MLQSAVTKEQIEAVLQRVRSWPTDRQEDAAKILLAMEAQSPEPYRLSPQESEEIETALAEAARGEFASDAEVAALFARYRR